MRIKSLIDRKTSRVGVLILGADSFEEERILKVLGDMMNSGNCMIKAFYDKGDLVSIKLELNEEEADEEEAE